MGRNSLAVDYRLRQEGKLRVFVERDIEAAHCENALESQAIAGEDKDEVERGPISLAAGAFSLHPVGKASSSTTV